MVSVDVKLYWTMLTHWSQLVPNNSTDIPRPEVSRFVPRLVMKRKADRRLTRLDTAASTLRLSRQTVWSCGPWTLSSMLLYPSHYQWNIKWLSSLPTVTQKSFCCVSQVTTAGAATGKQYNRRPPWPLRIIVQELCQWESRSVAVLGCPANEPSGFRGRKAILNHALALVTACP